MTTPTPFKLTTEDRQIFAALADHLGQSRAGVLRLAIRQLARIHGISYGIVPVSGEKKPKKSAKRA